MHGMLSRVSAPSSDRPQKDQYDSKTGRNQPSAWLKSTSKVLKSLCHPTSLEESGEQRKSAQNTAKKNRNNRHNGYLGRRELPKNTRRAIRMHPRKLTSTFLDRTVNWLAGIGSLELARWKWLVR
jgi:hypothetical protein